MDEYKADASVIKFGAEGGLRAVSSITAQSFALFNDLPALGECQDLE